MAKTILSIVYPITLLIISLIPLFINGHSIFTVCAYSCDSHTSLWTEDIRSCFPIFCKLTFLSTAIIVFTVVFLYTSKPVSFLYNIPTTSSLLQRLYTTFHRVTVTILGCTIVFTALIILLIIAVDLGLVISVIAVFLLFLAMHAYIIYLCFLTNCFLAVEHASGFLTNSLEILKGRARMATLLVFGYSVILGAICGLLEPTMLHGIGGEYYKYGVFSSIVVGSFLGFLVTVNSVGLWCCSKLCFTLGWDILERMKTLD